jgi:hypothetical protein
MSYPGPYGQMRARALAQGAGSTPRFQAMHESHG